MIARLRRVRGKKPVPTWHRRYLEMLPTIQRCANFAFGQLDEESRAEAVAEVVAIALVAFVRLVQQGKEDLAYPTVLARYAVRQVRSGRRAGNRLNTRDVLAEVTQRCRGLVVERLDGYDRELDEWTEAVVEDSQTPVPDQVAFRCDFPAWLATHSTRDRRLAETLALGHSTGEVAHRFNITSGRVSQLRQHFYASWLRFHGEK